MKIKKKIFTINIHISYAKAFLNNLEQIKIPLLGKHFKIVINVNRSVIIC